MSLPPLRQVITADTGQFDRAIGNATSRLRRFAGPAAVGAAVTALTAMTRSSMRNIDELAKQARSLGIATDRLQAMSMVAQEAGVSQGQLTNALGRMQQAITQAEDGLAGATRALDRLGVSSEELRGLAPDEQFRRIAEGLSGIQDPAQRTTAAMEIFGRSGRDLTNMLDDYGVKLDEAAEHQRRFGIAVSDEQAEAIEAANDAIGRLGSAFQGLGNTLAVTLAPTIERTARVIGDIAGAIMDRATPAVTAHEQAMVELNKVLGVYAETAAPEAGAAALNLAEDMKVEAKAALDAARAHLALMRARYAEATAQETGDPFQALMVGEEMSAAQRAVNEFEANLAEIQGRIDDLMDPEGRIFHLPQVFTDGRSENGEDDDPPIAPGIGGASAVRDQMAERLEALVNSLQTEAETVAEWYEDGLAVLTDARERGLLTEEEFHEQRERLEEEHQRRLAAIRQAANAQHQRDQAHFWRQAEAAARMGGDRVFRVVQALSAARSLMNAWTAYTEVLADPAFVGRPWARFAAAARVLSAGLGAVNAIRNVSSSGGGATSAPGTSGTAAAPAAIPTQTIRFDFGGQQAPMGMEQLVDMLNEAHDRGFRIRGVLA